MSRQLDEKWKSWFADWKVGPALQRLWCCVLNTTLTRRRSCTSAYRQNVQSCQGTHTWSIRVASFLCILKGLGLHWNVRRREFWFFNIRRERRASMRILKSLILWRGPVGNIQVERCVSFQVWLTEHKASKQPSTVTTITITTSATSHQRATTCYNLPTLHRQEKPRRLSSIHRCLKLSLQRHR